MCDDLSDGSILATDDAAHVQSVIDRFQSSFFCFLQNLLCGGTTIQRWGGFVRDMNYGRACLLYTSDAADE